MKLLELLFLRIAIRLNHLHFNRLAKRYPGSPEVIGPMITRSDERLSRYLDRVWELTGGKQ